MNTKNGGRGIISSFIWRVQLNTKVDDDGTLGTTTCSK